MNFFFFLSKDVINYCYHAMGEHAAVRGAINLWSEPKSTGTKDMVTFFFPVCIITDRLIFSC